MIYFMVSYFVVTNSVSVERTDEESLYEKLALFPWRDCSLDFIIPDSIRAYHLVLVYEENSFQEKETEEKTMSL